MLYTISTCPLQLLSKIQYIVYVTQNIIQKNKTTILTQIDLITIEQTVFHKEKKMQHDTGENLLYKVQL